MRLVGIKATTMTSGKNEGKTGEGNKRKYKPYDQAVLP